MNTLTNLFCTFRGVAVYLTDEGLFSATPAGKRKAREATTFLEIKAEIIDAEQSTLKRIDPNVKLRIFRNGKVMEVTYVGVRRKDTAKSDSGHNFLVDGDMKVLNFPQIVKDAAPAAELESLETAARVLKTAQMTYDAKLKMLTNRTQVPYVYCNMNTEDANERAQRFVTKLKQAQK